MPIFILRAVRRSADGRKAAHVASRWPYDAHDLSQAKAFVDRTPSEGWSDADTFEVADGNGRRLACRAITGPSAGTWIDEKEAPSPFAETSDFRSATW